MEKGQSENAERFSVVLCKEDIPWAKLPREKPAECNVQQLKQWLRCRGACSSG